MSDIDKVVDKMLDEVKLDTSWNSLDDLWIAIDTLHKKVDEGEILMGEALIPARDACALFLDKTVNMVVIK